MNNPARRDGTPEAHGASARDSARTRADDIVISSAKPARHQHPRGGNASARSVAESLGADWVFEGDDRSTDKNNSGERLQKVLARAGVASRRHSEILIDQGRVEVNGEVIKRQGVRVNPDRDIIRVDGARIRVDQNLQYFILNKLRGMQTTMQDDLGRPCVGDVVAEKVASGQRLFHVGRLDADTEGLLLLTNDGELANRLIHPAYEVKKTYVATVLGEGDRSLVKTLEKGIELDDGLAKADHAHIIDKNQGFSIVQVELHEGRKHIVRRLLKAAGYPVQRLVRTKFHTLSLGEMKPGGLRAVNDSELTSLYKAVEM